VVVELGVAVGLAQDVQLKVPEGDQTNVPPPLAFNVVFPPGQIVTSGPAFTEGGTPTLIVIVSTAVPQLLVTARV
jgi:hypothetical protein